MYLTREEILGVQGVKTEEVAVPEWGGVVLVRELAAAEVTQIGMNLVAAASDEATIGGGRSARTVQVEQLAEHFPRIVAQCVVDGPDTLRPVLSLQDVERFSAGSTEPLQRIAGKAMQLTGMYSEGDEEEGEPAGVDAEALEKAAGEGQDPNA